MQRITSKQEVAEQRITLILTEIQEKKIKRYKIGIQTFEGVGLEGVLCLKGVCRRLLSTAVVEHGYLRLERVILINESRKKLINIVCVNGQVSTMYKIFFKLSLTYKLIQ